MGIEKNKNSAKYLFVFDSQFARISIHKKIEPTKLIDKMFDAAHNNFFRFCVPDQFNN